MPEETPRAADQNDDTPEPVREFLSATAAHGDHEDVSRLKTELESPNPNGDVINEIVGRLHLDPQLGAGVRTWWNSPTTQSYIAELNAMGL